MKFKLKRKAPTLQDRLRLKVANYEVDSSTFSMLEASDLLEQAADRIDELEKCIGEMDDIIAMLEAKFNNENLN